MIAGPLMFEDWDNMPLSKALTGGVGPGIDF